MSSVEAALQSIRRVVNKLGTVEAARQSGVPYTTLHEAMKRDFVGKSIATLEKLANFAEAHERETGDDQQDAA